MKRPTNLEIDYWNEYELLTPNVLVVSDCF